jgi:hypothetical protein
MFCKRLNGKCQFGQIERGRFFAYVELKLIEYLEIKA